MLYLIGKKRQLFQTIFFVHFLKADLGTQLWPLSVAQIFYFFNYKESLLLSRGISLKVICENIKFLNYDYQNNFHDHE